MFHLYSIVEMSGIHNKMPSLHPAPKRLSVPTPGAKKQSGMPPLPPPVLQSNKPTSNGYVSPSTNDKFSFKQYPNSSPTAPPQLSYGPPPSARNIPTNSGRSGSNRSSHPNKSSSCSRRSPVVTAPPRIVGGVPLTNLIPPPPPPSSSPGPAYDRRFSNKGGFYP